MNLASIIMEAFAMESSLQRSRKLASAGSGAMLRTPVPYLIENRPRRMRRGRRSAALCLPRARVCQSRSGERYCTPSPGCRATAGKRALHGLTDEIKQVKE
jgi:hypothetical protein